MGLIVRRTSIIERRSLPSPPPILDQFSASDLPNLWRPRPDQFFKVDSFPVLGTGKLDLRGLKALALKLAS